MKETYHTKRRRELIAAGLCGRCGKRPPVNEHTHCRPCLDYNKGKVAAAKADPKRRADYAKTKLQWAQTNKERVQKSNLTSYYRQRENCPEKVLVRYRREVLRRTHPEVPFTITYRDIAIPETCPILGIPLKMAKGKFAAGSPTLDRIRPELGYVPGNVQVISHRANTLKNNATIEELEKVLAFLKSYHADR